MDDLKCARSVRVAHDGGVAGVGSVDALVEVGLYVQQSLLIGAMGNVGSLI